MKDSGYKWIGQIPDDWKVERLKGHFTFGKGLPITKADLIEEGAPVISYGQIHSKTNTGVKLDDSLERFVSKDFINSNPQSLVEEGDFIFADTSEDVEGCGACVYVDKQKELFAGYHTIIARSNNKQNNKYFAYLFLTDNWRSQIREKVDGVKLFSTTQTILKQTYILLPPQDQQKKIADFLDAKCSELQTAIDNTKQTIEEYKKLKQAVITKAVTKGLEPNRKMKDSDIEWIGEIPEAWETANPKSLFSLRKQKATKGERQLSASQKHGIVYQDEYMEMTGARVVTVMKDFDILKHVEAGDFVIHMRSFQGGIEYSEKSGSISSAYVMLIPNLEYVYPRYYKWLLKSENYIRALNGTTDLVRDGQAMRYSNFAQVRLIRVPIAEQKSIAEYLDCKCSQIDMIISQKEQFITELEKYKQSLIYEYVTGKKQL